MQDAEQQSSPVKQLEPSSTAGQGTRAVRTDESPAAVRILGADVSVRGAARRRGARPALAGQPATAIGVLSTGRSALARRWRCRAVAALAGQPAAARRAARASGAGRTARRRWLTGSAGAGVAAAALVARRAVSALWLDRSRSNKCVLPAIRSVKKLPIRMNVDFRGIVFPAEAGRERREHLQMSIPAVG